MKKWLLKQAPDRTREMAGESKIVINEEGTLMNSQTRLAVRSLSCVAVVLLAVVTAQAQDPFEIQIYEYETVPKGMWNLETHLNYVGRGTRVFEGSVAPSHNQFHLTFELTRGITDHVELAGVVVRAARAALCVGWVHAQ